ncbi:MAG: hypothetical protein R2800_05180 [Flavipsychrobacter sp.]
MYRKSNTQFAVMLLFPTLLMLSGCCGCGKYYNNGKDNNACIVLNGTSILAYNNEDSVERAIYDKEPVYGDALLLRVTLKTSTVLCYKKPETNILFPAAYATTCRYDIAPNRYKDSIVHYYISANKPYDDRNPGGAELNEFFLMPTAEELNGKGVFDILGIKRPATSGEYIYTINIQLADGRYIEAHTSSINVAN